MSLLFPRCARILEELGKSIVLRECEERESKHTITNALEGQVLQMPWHKST